MLRSHLVHPPAIMRELTGNGNDSLLLLARLRILSVITNLLLIVNLLKRPLEKSTDQANVSLLDLLKQRQTPP